ncbi:MAG: PEP-CTERM sorting domain-containing protein [Planctomycetia bacterium]
MRFATNWNSTASPLTVPGVGDIAVFNQATNNSKNIALQSNQTLDGVRFLSTANQFIFAKDSAFTDAAGGLTFIGTGTTLENLSTNGVQTFDMNLNVSSSAQTFFAVAGGATKITQLNVNGNAVTSKGDTEITGLTSTGTTGSYTIDGGVAKFTLANSGGTAENHLSFLKVLNGSVTSTGAGTHTDLIVEGGTYSGGGTFKSSTQIGGVQDLSGANTLSQLNVEGYKQTGGLLKMNIGYSPFVDADNPAFTVNSTVADSNGFSLGGDAILYGDRLGGPGQNLGTQLFGLGTTWNLFSGGGNVDAAGNPSAPNAATNFSTFALESPGSLYAGGFTKFGQEFIGPTASDGTYMVFQAATGNLVVVPEPSTMVFAGLGVAMSGWTMWKKRRLSRLLAAKAG